MHDDPVANVHATPRFNRCRSLMLVPNIIDEGRDKHRGDAMLKMIAAFVHEMTEGEPLKRFAGCVTPDEAALSHRLSTAALKSQTKGSWKLCRATPRMFRLRAVDVGCVRCACRRVG